MIIIRFPPKNSVLSFTSGLRHWGTSFPKYSEKKIHRQAFSTVEKAELVDFQWLSTKIPHWYSHVGQNFGKGLDSRPTWRNKETWEEYEEYLHSSTLLVWLWTFFIKPGLCYQRRRRGIRNVWPQIEYKIIWISLTVTNDQCLLKFQPFAWNAVHKKVSYSFML